MNFINRFLPAILLMLAVFQPAHANESIEMLKPGESLSYRVGWGLLGHAGNMKVSAAEEFIDGRSHTRMTTTSATQGFVRLLYNFDGEAQMLFDARDGRLLNATATTQAKKEQTNASITFDYAQSEASYVDHLNPKRNIRFPMPEGMPMDFITSLIQTRSWALAPGQSRDVLVLFDKDFYRLKITAEREETISTPTGKRKTVLLIPRMIGEPKGMFRRGGEVRVWVSADADRLPLRFEVKLKVGTAYAVLTDYQPPSKP